MNTYEIIVPYLNTKNISNDFFSRCETENIYTLRENITEFICDDGIYTYNKSFSLIKKNILSLKSNIYYKERETDMYIECDKNQDIDNSMIYVNSIQHKNEKCNSLPIKHSIIQYNKSIFKTHKIGMVSLVVEEYENIPQKKYFNTNVDFISNIDTIRNELNMLISLFD